jgi:deoxyribodipyrimidine photo-lyase
LRRNFRDTDLAFYAPFSVSDAASAVPAERLSARNAAPADPGRGYVLYWQVMARRTRYNFALEHALALAAEWRRPLVVLEALRAGYPWANDRLHRFALDGTADNAAAYRRAGVAHHAYVEPSRATAAGCWRRSPSARARW